ncbi:MAG: TIGR04282 family arsenosugar biosynthesis glycosyltransferase [Deltaproteobacteria bacterium]|nr:TIGR04282 family arsenosugar biosynthesis glycosyltransferase [Deltaproteobacteria bacterium]
MQNRAALAIMLKCPKPGEVKTRLVPPLSYGEAAGLYGAFLKDIFAKVSVLRHMDIYAACAPEGAEGILEIIPRDIVVFFQEGGTLGERMYNVFKDLFGKGYRAVVVIGSDSPDIPAEYFKDAEDALLEADLVLGPADDGGYYLIAMKELSKLPFEGILWSTGTVLQDTLKKAGAALSVKLISPWHDIDRIEDVRLIKESGAPQSYRYIKALGL